MPLIPYPVQPNAIMEVTYEYMVNGQQNINLFHYVYTGTSVNPDGRQLLIDMATKLLAPGGMNPAFVKVVSEDAGLLSTYLQWISPERFAYYTIPTTQPFLGSSPALPQNVAMAVTKRGINAGRSAIGTVHTGGVPADFVANGNKTNTAATAFADLLVNIPKDITLPGAIVMSPVLFNRTTPAESEFVAEAFLQETSRVNRRRTVGLGA